MIKRKNITLDPCFGCRDSAWVWVVASARTDERSVVSALRCMKSLQASLPKWFLRRRHDLVPASPGMLYVVSGRALARKLGLLLAWPPTSPTAVDLWPCAKFFTRDLTPINVIFAWENPQ